MLANRNTLKEKKIKEGWHKRSHLMQNANHQTAKDGPVNGLGGDGGLKAYHAPQLQKCGGGM